MKLKLNKCGEAKLGDKNLPLSLSMEESKETKKYWHNPILGDPPKYSLSSNLARMFMELWPNSGFSVAYISQASWETRPHVVREYWNIVNIELWGY